MKIAIFITAMSAALTSTFLFFTLRKTQPQEESGSEIDWEEDCGIC